MPFQPVPQGIQVLANYRQAGQELQSQFYFDRNATVEEEDVEGAAQVVLDWLANSWADVASNAVTIASVIATDMSVEGGVQRTLVPIGTLTGALSSPALPTGSTITASWRTGLSGRSFRGRTYHVGLTEAQVQNNEVTPTERLALFEAYAQLITDSIAFGSRLSVCSRVSGGVLRPNAILTTINAVIVEAYIDSQRRRLTGRGR